MERTDKVKIVLVVLLVLLAARTVLHYFFRVPLEFLPYDVKSEAGVRQAATVTDIRFVFAVTSEREKPRYFYLVHTEDGAEGVFTTQVRYNDEQFEQPLSFTGKTYRLPQERPSTLVFDEGFQANSGLDSAEIYRMMQGMTALDLSYTDTSEDNPATFWVSIATAIAFCVMMAMLLKEYFGGKRKGDKKTS